MSLLNVPPSSGFPPFPTSSLFELDPDQKSGPKSFFPNPTSTNPPRLKQRGTFIFNIPPVYIALGFFVPSPPFQSPQSQPQPDSRTWSSIHRFSLFRSWTRGWRISRRTDKLPSLVFICEGSYTSLSLEHAASHIRSWSEETDGKIVNYEGG